MIGTVAGWAEYAAARGMCVPAGSLALQALTRASDYIALNYVARFVAPWDENSPCVAEAVYEAATLEGETPGFFSSAQAPTGAKILTRVGEIEWEQIEGFNAAAGGAADAALPVSSKIEALIGKYLPGGGVCGAYAGGFVV